MLLHARTTVLKNHMPRGVVGVFSLSLIQRLSVYHLALVVRAVARRYGQAVNAFSEGSWLVYDVVIVPSLTFLVSRGPCRVRPRGVSVVYAAVNCFPKWSRSVLPMLRPGKLACGCSRERAHCLELSSAMYILPHWLPHRSVDCSRGITRREWRLLIQEAMRDRKEISVNARPWCIR